MKFSRLLPSLVAFCLTLGLLSVSYAQVPPELQQEIDQAVRNFHQSEEGEECREEQPRDQEEEREMNEEIRECVIEHLSENSSGFQLPDLIIIVAQALPCSFDEDNMADVRQHDPEHMSRNEVQHVW